MRSRLIEREGVPLHGLWRSGDDGVPIIVVPGAMAAAESYRPVVEAIERPEPVLVLDRRGRADSGPQPQSYSVATEVADLRQWIDHLGGPVVVFGWSYGATIALELAGQDDRIAQVIGYEPVLAPFGADLLPALRKADADTRVEIINRDLSRVPAQEVAALRQSPVWPSLCRLAEPALGELEAINAFEPGPGWADLAPELIVGDLSLGVEPYGPGFDRAAARLPRARTTILPGQGHLAHLDDPAALGRLVTGLLD
ncbi:MAG TPA: alpha/beta hydrolase [Candidatus Avipropionibacterium avicola]|uniref:Alpha/beta hydrolase n=1 Tax=Candidatus Avipropionibacterium avicola TaxID=2840701 RepID=A0A9D1GZD7_9ACTN|nr:alpha/beta hydrolase [Candidatus Avipropionibacterium avicola]